MSSIPYFSVHIQRPRVITVREYPDRTGRSVLHLTDIYGDPITRTVLHVYLDIHLPVQVKGHIFLEHKLLIPL